MRKGSLLFKPGTIITMFFIAVLGVLVLNWASENVIDSVDNSGDQATHAIRCSNIETEVVDSVTFGNTTEISYIINTDVEKVYVAAESSEGFTDTSIDTEPVAGELNSVEVELDNVSSFSVSTPLCDSSLQ